jgi:uncharacterized membrane protein YgdD (TMEM256/DUF423 family)
VHGNAGSRGGFLAAGAVSGFVAVAAGAFGAHGLRDVLPAERLDVFEVGARYQMYHALALVACDLVPGGGALRSWAGRLFLAGTVAFSGSLYVVALGGVRAFGAVTPFGGVSWLLAWAFLAVAALGPRRAA